MPAAPLALSISRLLKVWLLEITKRGSLIVGPLEVVDVEVVATVVMVVVSAVVAWMGVVVLVVSAVVA